MLHTSHPIGPATAGKYFEEHYSSVQGQYYSEGHALAGEWHGRLAAELGLGSEVRGEAFERLVNGQDPATGEQWIGHRSTHRTASGKEMAHRSAWDLTFSAPKEVSLTALVGGDEAVREAHRVSVRAALDAGEMYTQARGGGRRPAVTTGKWIVAIFEHDTARPERLETADEQSLYPAPHLHSHSVMMNLTVDGRPRSLETGELFKAQRLMKAVYQSELKFRLRQLGYTVHEGVNQSAEIQGYTKEYLAAESLRSARIRGRLEELGMSGPRAAEIIAHQDRNAKLELSAEEVKALHRARAAEYGSQPEKVVAQARERRREHRPEREMSAQEAVSSAKRSVSERLAVFDHFDLVSQALKYGQGRVRVKDVERNIAERRGREFLPVRHGRRNTPGLQYTTSELVRTERDVLEMTLAGRDRVRPLSASATEEQIRKEYAALQNGRGMNSGQAKAAAGILRSPDRVTGLQGAAGTGKTTSTLRVITDYAKRAGMEVVGLAPTGRARKELQAAGIPAQTLQRFLTRNRDDALAPRLLIVDESSLVSTRQYRELLKRIEARPGDRVLEVGDVRQHESVEAARIFDEQQRSGMRTLHLDQIVRQQNPELAAVVEMLQAGKASAAIRKLGEQGRVNVATSRRDRLNGIARDYAGDPCGTLVISPDNESRRELNRLIRGELRKAGGLGEDIVTAQILVSRQNLTKEDRRVAGSYEVGSVVRFRVAARSLGVVAGEYATVIDRDSENNTVAVKTHAGAAFRYNPATHFGVELFEQQRRELAAGDQIIFRAPWKDRAVATGDRAEIETVDAKGNLRVRLGETGRALLFNVREMPHLDYAYASTSCSAQGATADRVLVHMQTTEKGAKQLLTQAMAYVSLSRPRHEVRVWTDDQERLERMLETSEVKKMALSPEQISRYAMERSA